MALTGPLTLSRRGQRSGRTDFGYPAAPGVTIYTGLAPVFVKQVIAILQTAIGTGTALLIAEQNVAFLALADRGTLIDGGRVKLSGTRAELESSDAVREAYFGL